MTNRYRKPKVVFKKKLKNNKIKQKCKKNKIKSQTNKIDLFM